MSSRGFIEKLLLRLKSGDARSIHLNALPANFARLDIYDLANIEPSLHLRFLQTLLSKESFRFSITIDAPSLDVKTGDESSPDKKKIVQKIIKRLNHLDYQEKEEFSEHGYHSFGFGYPLVIKRDPASPEKILKAPLLIWYLDIEKDHKRNNTWIISRNEDHPLIFNELLRSHIESSEQVKTNDLDNFIEEDFISEPQLILLCKSLLEKLNIPFNEIENIATLLPSTNKETIESVTKQSPWIRWSGIFGLYKMQKQSIIKDLEELLQQDEILDDAPKVEETFFDGELLTPVHLDPSQENVLQQLKETNSIIIQGPPGTGKSQSLTAIITQALLNKQKVLVVCEKRTAMEVLYNNLQKVNLHHLCALIEDVYADRKNIVEQVRSRVEEVEQPVMRFRNNEYEQVRAKFLSLQEEINHRINFTKRHVFGDDTWMELLDRSYVLNKDHAMLDKANSINKNIRNSDYLFTYEEFITLEEKIRIAQELYSKVDKKASLFDELNTSVFADEASPEMIFKDLKEMKKRGNSVAQEIQSAVDQYLSSYNNLTGIAYNSVSIFSLIFSKYKNIRKQQQQALADYASLMNVVHQKDYFTLNQASPAEKMENLIPQLQQLQQRTGTFLELQDLFLPFFQYKKFLLRQDDKTKALIYSLISINDIDWKEIFTIYYLNQVILKTAIENGIKDDAGKLFKELEHADTELKKKLGEKINSEWQETIQQAIKKQDLTEVKYLYNQRKNKQFSSRNSLRKIIQKDFDFFTTLFPVLMVNPSVGTSILPLKSHLFDLVILDEASQLRIEDTFSSLLRAKTKIISGDKHQMPPSNFFGNEVVFWNEEDEDDASSFLAESKSLLEYADDASYKNSFLDYHYRSLHPDLIQFSNHAFYQSRLIPLPAKNDYQSLYYYNVEGLYAEGMNAEEAREIVRFIYQVEMTNGEYPSIGIATFNIYQRDLIYDELYDAAYADKEKNDKLQALLNKGLFVKNLENIQGDERDIMILSTTFGRDEHGKFRQAFGPLTQEKGYQLLNVIITRAKHSLYVFTSIPETVFQDFHAELSQKGNTGKSIFYAYLSYVKACTENDESQMEFIKSSLQRSRNVHPAKSNNDEGILKEFVFDELEKIFAGKAIRNYMLGGFILDIILLKEGKPFLHIDFENTEKYHPDVSYRIKLHRQKMVADYNIKTYHLWSYNWWRNAQYEIASICNAYEES